MFVLRSKKGHGHVLSMVLPPGHPNQYKHHLLTSKAGQYCIDTTNIGSYRGIEDVVQVLQGETFGALACPLLLTDFDAPTFDDRYGGEEPAYDTAGGALSAVGGLDTMGSMGSALYDSAVSNLRPSTP